MKYKYLQNHQTFKAAAFISLILSAFAIIVSYNENSIDNFKFNQNIIVHLIAVIPIMIIGLIFSNYAKAVRIRYGIYKKGMPINTVFMYIGAYFYIIEGFLKSYIGAGKLDEKEFYLTKICLGIFIACVLLSIFSTKLIVRECRKKVQCCNFEKDERCYEKSCINCTYVRNIKGDNFKERLKVEFVKNHAEYVEEMGAKTFAKARREIFSKRKIKFSPMIGELKEYFKSRYVTEDFQNFFFDIDIKQKRDESLN